MKITTKKPLRPRGRNSEKRQETKDNIAEVYAHGPVKPVQIIPATKETEEGATKKKLRVCAYCRVSTEEDNQASSYELQVQNYTKMIKENDAWEFVNIPFFVNTETGEIEQSFRQRWSPFPPRLDTHSGTVVH